MDGFELLALFFSGVDETRHYDMQAMSLSVHIHNSNIFAVSSEEGKERKRESRQIWTNLIFLARVEKKKKRNEKRPENIFTYLICETTSMFVFFFVVVVVVIYF